MPVLPVTNRPRTTISDEVFGRLRMRLAADHPELTDLYISRIIDQTLAFLDACARTPDTALSPSKPVDLGWHAFILHTADYADFCQRAAGRFIHHLPAHSDGQTAATITETTATMRALGLPVDDELWATASTGKCTQCHAGCYDSPKGR